MAKLICDYVSVELTIGIQHTQLRRLEVYIQSILVVNMLLLCFIVNMHTFIHVTALHILL